MFVAVGDQNNSDLGFGLGGFIDVAADSERFVVGMGRKNQDFLVGPGKFDVI